MPILNSREIIRPSLNIRLENFRIFRDSEWFRLAPLTCLVGRNSSGKSSIISLFLLLKQTLEQQSISTTPSALNLSGPYCDLGNYIDIVHNHNESSNIKLSFTVDLHTINNFFNGDRDPIIFPSLPRPLPNVSRYLQWRWGWRKWNAHISNNGAIRMSFGFSMDKRFGPSLSHLEIEITGLGTAIFTRTSGIEREQHWRVYISELPGKSLTFRQMSRDFFPYIDSRENIYMHSGPRIKHKIKTFVLICQAMFQYLNELLSTSNQVGPFRTPPERRYAGTFNTSISKTSGEQAVNLLIMEALLRNTNQRMLHEETSFWVKHLGLAKSLSIEDLGKHLNLFEVNIKGARQNTKANLTDVGFGISQILPVIVQGLLMRRGGIYLVQQPEIHLHPDAQAGLADFFLFLAGNGVMTIVETHSEYLLLRLRRRLAEGKMYNPSNYKEKLQSITVNDVSILLTGSDKNNSKVKSLQINKSFQFSNMPKGFMDQALTDRAALFTAVSKTYA